MRTGVPYFADTSLNGKKKEHRRPFADDEKLPNVQRIDPSHEQAELPGTGETTNAEEWERPRSWWKKDS